MTEYLDDPLGSYEYLTSFFLFPDLWNRDKDPVNDRSLRPEVYINRERDKMGNSWSSNVSTTKDGWVRKPSAFGAGKKPKKDAGGHGGNSNIQAGSSDKKSKKSKSSKTMTKDGWVRKPSAFGSNPKRSNKHGVLGNFAADSGATATHSSHTYGDGSGCAHTDGGGSGC
ncbi:hypothetical protein PGTUg99_018522 [Puccinia graminis f. sp. tritici]|uniref:Uncharacterized protein n=1 Tax=Puccinia graminis f. sp. tritici TaxID=56615 RepID=A0A5B0NP12_PUCGR|nr:hypothetical protein PGTUg99_018522 [Puccinia graminis f. sp. tritici]